MSAPFDPAALARKYAEERQKRIENGDRTSIEAESVFPDIDKDPWAVAPINRAPLIEEVDALTTGCGIAGIVAAVQLVKAGVTNIRMIDAAGDFGGTWYWNRYPGIRCDIESYIYLPLLEDAGTIPSEKYSSGAEILAHLQTLARRFGLYDKALFQTRIASAIWDEPSARWHVRTDRGDLIKARFLLGASGFLHRPKIPNIPGVKEFRGKIFHPSRWDFEFTGGDSKGGLSKLKGKRVGLIGTGATGIQILPHLAPHAADVYLFQRTPAPVSARNNRATDVAWFQSQSPGWQIERANNFEASTSGAPVETDLVDDCWTRAAKQLFGVTATIKPGDGVPLAEALQLYDYELMQGLRDRIDEIVKDPKTAEALKPWYNLFCKRPLYADDYLEAFNHPNVHLIETEGRGVERLTETGAVVNGQHYELDCLIVASGYKVGAYEEATTTFPIIGRNGVPLSESWAADIHSVHGLWVHGYPNFQLVGTVIHAALSFNYSWFATEQAAHAATIISTSLKENIGSIEVTKEAEDRWAALIEEKRNDRTAFNEQCTPGFYNNEGDSSKPGLPDRCYGGGAFAYNDIIRAWRTGGFRRDARIEPPPAQCAS